MLKGLVDAAQATRMLAYFQRHDVLGTNGLAGPPDQPQTGQAMPSYTLRAVLENSEICELMQAPRVLRVASAYLGCKPTLSSIGVRWSFPGNPKPGATQQFHRDPDDWKFLKLFVYLTDVDEDCGPHTYVQGSHRTAGQMRARPYSQATVDQDYPSQARAITGPRGTAFMADTHGIHAGLVPTARPRLMLQVQYSMLPVFAFRYEPIALEAKTGIEPYVSRLLLRGSPVGMAP